VEYSDSIELSINPSHRVEGILMKIKCEVKRNTNLTLKKLSLQGGILSLYSPYCSS